MSNHEPLLKIRFAGDAIGAGRIPVSHLVSFLSEMTKAFQRTGRVLQGDAQSCCRGQMPRTIKEEISLELVLLTHGSPEAVLGFDRSQSEPCLPGMDFGMEILEKTVSGLDIIQGDADILPVGFDTGVLMAWRDAGKLFSKGVNRIEISLNHREVPAVSTFTPEGFVRIQERIKGPDRNIRTIEGRLLMADFKENGARCRVHPSSGEPILCIFEEEKRDEVLENILHFVRIIGEAEEDTVTGKINSIRIHDIERLEDRSAENVNLLPVGTPISRSFWESPSLEELAESQHVSSVRDVEALYGTWPDDADDGFEESVHELRHPQSRSDQVQ